nr:MAG: major capsid protein [Microvirus sp.]
MSLNRSLPAVDPSHFAMVPRSDVPRSTFQNERTYKTTFDTGYLVPIYVDEVLPGDVHDGSMTVFARLNNLLFPLMDNLEIETFFFFVPNRIVWANWKKFMGEQAKPTDSISYTIPQTVSPATGFAVGSLFDYFGLPTVGQVGAGTVSVNSLPLRAFNLIFNEWFRDENLQDGLVVPSGDGPDGYGNFNMVKRNKKHDYFTSCLPWPQKGGVEITLPLGGSAVVKTNATDLFTGSQPAIGYRSTAGASYSVAHNLAVNASSKGEILSATATGLGGGFYPSNLYADLSTATGATINAMRLSIATQQFLEKDARGGTRYTELLKNHFGVTPEDARLQRPEYIGGGRSALQTQAIPQTSATKITGSDTAVGSLSGQSVASGSHRFRYHATEHGYIIGLANVAADITYQQGLNRMWSRSTRYDFYWPTFAKLGEQAVLNKEIFITGGAADDAVFGYQERWAEYRYMPSMITGLFKSTSAGNIDEWHLSEQFGSLPALNSTFIQQTIPASRVLAAGIQANGMQVLFDSVTTLRRTRPVPTYSVPGLLRF